MERYAAVLIALTLTMAGATYMSGGTSERCDGCNVVVVSIDTLRADHLPTYGYDRNTAPAIDRVASEGLVFETAVAQSPWTTPSHFSLFTSLYPSQHRSEGSSDRFTMLATALREEGYTTAGFHGGGNVRGELGFDRGFDSYHRVENPRRRFQEATGFVDNLLSNSSRPVFLFYHTYQVHDPYLPPQEYSGMYDGYNASFGERSRERWRELYTEVMAADIPRKNRTNRLYRRYRDWYIGELEEDPALRRHAVAEYDASIRATDDFIANLTDLLRAHDMADDTILLITSDHGEEFQEHGGWLHDTVHREVRQVPLIVRIPGKEHERVGEPVELIDVVPTLVDLLGLDPARFRQEPEGRSLLDTANGAETRFTLTEERGKVAYVNRTTRLALLREDRQSRVYDLADDPFEQDPITDAGTVDRLSAQFQRRMDALTDRTALLEERLQDLGYIR